MVHRDVDSGSSPQGVESEQPAAPYSECPLSIFLSDATPGV